MPGKAITKEVMEQYEKIRQLGPCNMFDMGCVQRIADEMDFHELGCLTNKEYVHILSNYGELMEKYGIERG